MSDAAEALHVAIKSALEGSADLATALGGAVRVFSTAPTNARPPYLVIGDDTIEGDDDECGEASEITALVNAWVKPNPPNATQIRQVGAAIRTALGADLAIDGFDQLVDRPFENARYVTDPDGSSHVIVTVRFNLEPVG
jgi:hypothetical protein